ncbi:MAG TPA: PIG-L family deacetylase [Acidimicrobiales bacterium]|jgi:LmbE family N-acetylglucosaminyl deacetylase|nr:PIG-L family deacetylase [Acidimicrobiales bacterium]
MATTPTLVCVHAHPDDEALFTAGITSHYADLGYRVVLITCTGGQLGIDDHGRFGPDPLHDDEVTRVTRAGELQRAARVAGFSRVVTLGYDESGMTGWAQNDSPEAFMNANVAEVARSVAALLDEEHATVVVTYDENGFYGHPDHIMANVVTRAALHTASSPRRLYYPVVPRGVLEEFVAGAKASGVSLPGFIVDALAVSDDMVSTRMDVRAFAKRKHEAIATHASQVDNADLVTMDEELFTLLFGIEYYQRAWSRDVTTGDETDLFGGL